MADVLITPASGKVEFKDASNNIDGLIELDGSGNLNISAPGGDLILGDTTSDVYIGNGINNIDIVFEQNGEIRGTAGVTLTLGSVGSNITMGTDLNIGGNDITNAATINGSITSNWDNAYDNYITGITVTGTTTKTITLTQRDGGTLAANFTDIDTNTTYTAGKGLTLTGTTFDVNVNATTQTVGANAVSATTARTYAVQVDASDNLVVNVPWSDTNTTYSKATASSLGLVKLWNATVNTVTTNSISSTASRNYGIQLNAGDQMVVNVPWTDTTYSTATTSDLGLVKIGYTENGKNYPVELNGTDQMYVNVPWTDTDTTYSAATNTTLGLVKIGYTENGKNYPVELSSDQMYVNVPWTDTDTNNYVTGISFNGSGTLTATRSGLGDLTAALASGDITGPLGYTPYQENTSLTASDILINTTTIVDSSRNLTNIGTYSGSGKLSVAYNDSATESNPMGASITVSGQGSGTVSYNSITGAQLSGGSSNVSGTHTISTIYGSTTFATAVLNSSGTATSVTNMIGSLSGLQFRDLKGSGYSVENAYGYYALKLAGTNAAPTNSYGIYLESLGGTTLDYGVYVESGSNYFGGPLELSDGTNTITATMLSTDTLSFSGDSGQLFSITDSLSGTIFAVNDISGVPSIEVDDDGTIRLAETFGNVLIGTAVDNGTSKLQVDGDIALGTSTSNARLLIDKADDDLADHIEFYSAGTKMGEIGSLDTTWLRINQHTAKNIYTPRYIRADGGFFVNGTAKGIDASGNYIGGTITGASDANVANWDTAYGWGDHSTAGYLTSETSHADVLVDGDFASNGLMKRTAAGTYSTITDSSANWNTAYGWGDHSTAGYLTSITSSNVTTALGYTPYQENTSLTASDILINTTTIVDSSRNLTNINKLSMQGGSRSDTDEGTFHFWQIPDNGTDTTTWYKIADVAISTGLYKALHVSIQAESTLGNFGNTVNHDRSHIEAVFYRSAGTQDDQNNAQLYGKNPTSHVFRILKTATGVYELQVQSTGTYRYLNVRMWVNGTNGGTFQVATTAAAGSTTGTVYSITAPTESTTHPRTWFSRVSASALQINGTDIVDSSRNLTNINSATANFFNIVDSSLGGYIARDPGNNTGSLWLAARTAGTGTANRVTLAGGANTYVYADSAGFHIGQQGDFISFYGDANSSHSISAKSSTWATSDDIRINSYGSILFNLDSNNNNTTEADFLIGRHGGSATISSWLFEVDGETGDAIALGNMTAYGSPSDMRLKENIQPIEDALNKVKKLDGFTYNYKGREDRLAGVSAQALQEVLPECVYETHDIQKEEKYLAVRYGNTVALLIEAIKEQQTQIDELKAQVQSLKEK